MEMLDGGRMVVPSFSLCWGPQARLPLLLPLRSPLLGEGEDVGIQLEWVK
ncbi:putative polyprotein [Sesbania bispinosa]|nr:putative polyprotein [Sesbania bispinosa]